ncbi:hypothetical protein BOX15_Mlig001647g1 [Macrostomum lignano]|uniref:Ras-related protein Rab-24 n=1 Tax=Macrostomum lignano TaxID=282301 RepID=A0A267GRL9_9PLAT|nr:hypothetical protein BOX15_Mlig001647g2 [Macrostomum lignano]PAA88718.1 hypothetical protein BOX15_Mlig001647g1 [Macrostomum lignano]
MNDSSAYDAIKVVLVGSSSAGKSCLLSRFASDEFDCTSVSTRATLASAFFAKSVLVGSRTVKLHLWDTAGSEEFRSVIPMYYRHARAAVLCYDITNYRTFNDLQYWIDELTRKEPDCRLYLCGCKSDLQQDERQVSLMKAKQFAETNRAAFFETSARTGDNVTALFHRICCDVVEWDFVSITSGQRSAQRPEDPAASKKKGFFLKSIEADEAASERQQHKCFHLCKSG